jgi:general stress protein 26
MTQSSKSHVRELLEDFDTAMLITHAVKGSLNARPMGVAEISKSGELYFVTAAPSAKVKEIQKDAHVALIFQDKKSSCCEGSSPRGQALVRSVARVVSRRQE